MEIDVQNEDKCIVNISEGIQFLRKVVETLVDQPLLSGVGKFPSGDNTSVTPQNDLQWAHDDCLSPTTYVTAPHPTKRDVMGSTAMPYHTMD